jgi:predicted MFS family arabinose efflux permease
MLLTLAGLAGIFGEVLGGWLSDIVGRIKTVNLGILLMTISVFSLMFDIPFIILGLIMIIWAVGWTFNHAGLSTILTDLPKEFLNEAASLNSGLRFASGGLGVSLAGIIMQRSFDFGFFIFGIGLIMLLIFTKNLELGG